MRVVILDPCMTVGQDQLGEQFVKILQEELNEYVNTCLVKSEMGLHSLSLTEEDLLIIFNKYDQHYSENIINILYEALQLKCDILPISLYETTREPASVIKHIQSFEIVDQLRQRRINRGNIETIALALVRLVLSSVHPTMAVKRMNLFISHRRLDGEVIAAGFYNELRRRANEAEAFRDLISIQVGMSAQEEIEKSLNESDAVIFLDTPLSGDSKWVMEELQIALGLNLPIVWVRIGGEKDRVILSVQPAEHPHFQFEQLDVFDLENNPNIIDEIIHKAFQITQTKAMTSIDHFSVLRKMERTGKVEIIPINKKNMVYQIKIPRKTKEFRYPERPVTHVIQLFGRNPKDTDRSYFNPMISEYGYPVHPHLGYHFDSGLLLGPNAFIDPKQNEHGIYIDSVGEYVTSIQRYVLSETTHSTGKKGIILSGAFPDCEPEYQQILINAIHAFAKAVFDKGGTIIFGSHPTFQHIILDLAKRLRPKDYLQATRMYLSGYYENKGLIDDLRTQSTVYVTDNVKNDRSASLTLMRQAMVKDTEAAGIILLGGKQHKTIKPGIDEELELAIQKGIPAFIIGSVGGRSSILANEILKQGELQINSLTRQQNQKLATSLAFHFLAEEILSSLGIYSIN